jgi:L-2-hydroxyglutarate oxidase
VSIPSYDVAIIGGGIVGLATALALVERGRRSLVVLEAEDQLAAHQSGHNSGVIHSGLYYKPGSLKAQNCVAGRNALYRFCQEQGIAHEVCGKVVVATHDRQQAALQELYRRGQANGLTGVRLLSPTELRAHEPYVSGVAGLLVPQTGIVHYPDVVQAYARLTTQAGGVIRTGTRLLKVVRDAGEIVLETSRDPVRCRFLINCGGLHCDRIARLCGLDPQLQIIPFRGEYYEIIPERRFLVRNLIYPVPDPQFPFLGVHFTRTIHGAVEAGPNAVLALKREGYRLRSISAKDVGEMVRYGGFWRMAQKHWRMGLGEFHRSLCKGAFVKALQELIPQLRPSDLRPYGAGVRAQAVDPNGQLVDDFRILRAERMIHVLNAPSPAATASLSIGQTIGALAA